MIVRQLGDSLRNQSKRWTDRPVLMSPNEETKEEAIPLGLPAGSHLGRFTIVSEIGRGGMGVVYRARDTRLDRDVAIKTLPSSVSNDRELLARFEREAKALAALNHPGIVTIFSVERDNDLPYLAMELLHGRKLSQVIDRTKVDMSYLLFLAIPLTSALAAAHKQGITHRDVKPNNIMVLDDDRLKVLDFGLATWHIVPDDSSTAELLTRSGSLVGTTPYMAPEIIRGQKADPRSDVFSLGVVLWEMAYGHRPFQGDNGAEIFSAILRDPPFASMVRDELPGSLVDLFLSCLEKQPEQRPASAEEVRKALEAVQSEASGGRSARVAEHVIPDEAQKIQGIAVLPLTDLSRQNPEEFFADGMTEALITDLAKLSRIKVISRTSMLQYRGTTKTIGQIAGELGVDAVVEGSILWAGDRIRLSAQLTLATTGELLWAERYERQLEDVLTLQDELARAIAGEVGATVDRHERSRAVSLPKVDPEVYLLVLRGRHFWNHRTESSFRTALDFFQQAIDRDPTYAPAYLGLAESLGMLANYGILPPAEVLPRSLAATKQALALDTESADAHRVRAFLHWQCEFAWQDAISEYEIALELDPSSWLTTYWYGAYLGVIGFFERSHRMLEHAAALDPLSLLVPCGQGWMYFFERRFEDAVPFYRRVLAIDPNNFMAHWFLGEALTEMHEFNEGIAKLERALDLSGRSSRMLGYLGYALGRAGRDSKALTYLGELGEREKSSYTPPYFPALVLVGLGRHEEALDRLEQAWSVRDSMLRDLKADPHWDHLHEHPRFEKLTSAMDFPKAVTS